jgi:hypothetical protein
MAMTRTPALSDSSFWKMVTPSVVAALVLGLLFTPALQGQSPFTLKRFGSLPVSDAEVAQIAELASSAEKRLWLLRTPNRVMTSERFSYLFLEPDVFGKRVLRGRALKVAKEPPGATIRSSWKIVESHSYAYIPTTGRRQGQIGHEDDIDWPFIVRAEFDDDTLISIVEFIRSQPPIPVPAFLKSVPAVPIVGIARGDADAIVVGLRPREAAMGHAVWLVRKDGRWVITRSETSIA